MLRIEIFDRRAPVAKLPEFAKAGLPLKMARAPRSTAVPESVCNCAVGLDSGISALKSTTSTVAFISADLNSDINLTKLNVSILGHKHLNFQFLDRKFLLSVNEQHFILWRSGLKPFTYV